MHADFIHIYVSLDGVKVPNQRILAVIHGCLAIHKPPETANVWPNDDIDYNEPGWRITQLPTGLMLCENEFTPFYVAVDTALKLEPIMRDAPNKLDNELLFDCWFIDNHRALLPILQAYIDW